MEYENAIKEYNLQMLLFICIKIKWYSRILCAMKQFCSKSEQENYITFICFCFVSFPRKQICFKSLINLISVDRSKEITIITNSEIYAVPEVTLYSCYVNFYFICKYRVVRCFKMQLHLSIKCGKQKVDKSKAFDLNSLNKDWQ